MQIIRNEQDRTLTLVAVTDQEREDLLALPRWIKPNEKISYDGRRSIGPENQYTVIMFNAGGHSEMVSEETSPDITVNRQVYVGGLNFEIQGDRESDWEEIKAMRDACYWGSGGMIYIKSITVEGRPAIIVTMMRCSKCGRNILEFNECEWKICDACAEKCEHEYVTGHVHGGSAGQLGWGEYCQKCGRGNPESEPISATQ